MSETGFRIFNQAFSAGAELTYAALLTAFFRPFVPQDKRRCGLLLVFFVYILFEIVCNRAALPQGSFGLILMAALKTVPEELLEAARIDGASWWQQFRRITLPFIKKFILLIVTLRFMDAIRMFDIAYNLTNGGPGNATETLASTIYKTAFRYYEVGEGSAGAYIFFLIIILCSFLFLKLAGREKS